ncbi:MAG: PIN domain-containing protein [Gemmatimonadota bacterium]|nr:PIN domain-containing protein [Gemmatimonadota bacterium]
MTVIYLDACCLNRPFDDQSQDRIRLESEAILLILAHMARREWRWVGSEVLDFEIQQTPDLERRRRVQVLAAQVAERVLVEQPVVNRANELQALGFGVYDALHLACAGRSGAEVFLTTDDALVRRARRNAQHVRIRVENPLTWLNEITGA